MYLRFIGKVKGNYSGYDLGGRPNLQVGKIYRQTGFRENRYTGFEFYHLEGFGNIEFPVIWFEKVPAPPCPAVPSGPLLEKPIINNARIAYDAGKITKVSGYKLIKIEDLLNGSYMITLEHEGVFEKIILLDGGGRFKKVPASELRWDDAFLQHKPKNEDERVFKSMLKFLIKNRPKDFWAPVYDPSLDSEGRICYEPGKKPALFKSYTWWEKNAKNFAPERGSRIGFKSERILFSATIIKELLTSGWTVANAWNYVLNGIKGSHNFNSCSYCKQGRDKELEVTGRREICGWYDLESTFKFVADDEKNDAFWIAGGDSFYDSSAFPLAAMERSTELNEEQIFRGRRPSRSKVPYHSEQHYKCCCGWIILPEDVTYQ